MNKDWTLNEKELLEAFKNKETSTKEKIEISNLDITMVIKMELLKRKKQYQILMLLKIFF